MTTQANPQEMLEALRDCEAALNYQVLLIHAREAAFRDRQIHARPMDWEELVANIYAATAMPLARARKVLAQVKRTQED